MNDHVDLPPCNECGKTSRHDYFGYCLDCADENGISSVFPEPERLANFNILTSRQFSPTEKAENLEKMGRYLKERSDAGQPLVPILVSKEMFISMDIISDVLGKFGNISDLDKITIPETLSVDARISAELNKACYVRNRVSYSQENFNDNNALLHAYFYTYVASYFVGMMGLYRDRVAVRQDILEKFGFDNSYPDFGSIDFLAGDVMIEALKLASAAESKEK